MGKATRNRKPRDKVDQYIDRPTPEQIASGRYHRDFVTHVDSATKATAYIAAHDPIQRWKRDGRLTDSQTAAIALTRRLWEDAGISQRTTAHYGQAIRATGNAEHRAAIEISARQRLHRIQDYFTGLGAYWAIFENVCRHGMAAGVAGSELGFGTRSGGDRAHTIVCFIADKIAEQERL